MEFLKTIFGDKSMTYDELVNALNTHNGDEANKDKQIKIANLGGGEYVGKGKYDGEIEKLNNLLSSKTTELDTANNLIAELKKGAKGNEELQGKITGYETQVAQLQEQLNETRIKSALKVALLSEKALDIDYLTFKINEKMREKGQSLELDENEKIKGCDDIMSDLKTQFPKQFESAASSGITPNPLPDGDHRETQPQSLAEALRMQYENKN
jgi:transposase